MIFRRASAPVLLYVLHSGNLYGTERMALATLDGLDEYATRVVVAPGPTETASVTDAARAAGYETVTFRSRWQLVRSILAWCLRHRTIDVIGVGVGSSKMCHYLGRLLNVRMRQLHVAHGGTGDAWSYANKRPLNSIPIRVIAVSDFVRRKLIEHGVRPDSISVIDNFLSDAQLKEYGRRAPYAGPPEALPRRPDPSSIKVAVVSRVDHVKKIDLLISAIETHGLANFRFDIYGTGADLETLKKRSAAMPNVCFHGYVSDVKQRLIDADLLLHLCPVEPFGLVVLEAFSSRLVVCVPDAGGTASLVEDGVCGLKFGADRAEAVSDVLHRFAGLAPERMQSLADAGAAALQHRFAQTEGIRRYRQALAATAASPGGHPA